MGRWVLDGIVAGVLYFITLQRYSPLRTGLVDLGASPYLGLEKGAEGAGGGAPSAEVEADTQHLHAYVNLPRERDIPDIDIYT